ncbi:MAG: prepilin-type N-terminal cleavage/methylation domain-containing protein [Planctomycetota bacterium]
MTGARSAAARRAFTLLELLLAVAILAALLGAVYFTVIGTVTSGERIAAAVAGRLEAAGVRDLLAADLRMALPDPPGDVAPVRLETGSGEAGGWPELTLLTTGSLVPSATGEAPPLTWVRYRVRMETGEDAYVLERLETAAEMLGEDPFATDDGEEEADAEVRRVPLCRVTRFAVRLREDEMDWETTWSEQTPPDAVAFDLTLAGDGDEASEKRVEGTIRLP